MCTRNGCILCTRPVPSSMLTSTQASRAQNAGAHHALCVRMCIVSMLVLTCLSCNGAALEHIRSPFRSLSHQNQNAHFFDAERLLDSLQLMVPSAPSSPEFTVLHSPTSNLTAIGERNSPSVSTVDDSVVLAVRFRPKRHRGDPPDPRNAKAKGTHRPASRVVHRRRQKYGFDPYRPGDAPRDPFEDAERPYDDFDCPSFSTNFAFLVQLAKKLRAQNRRGDAAVCSKLAVKLHVERRTNQVMRDYQAEVMALKDPMQFYDAIPALLHRPAPPQLTLSEGLQMNHTYSSITEQALTAVAAHHQKLSGNASELSHSSNSKKESRSIVHPLAHPSASLNSNRSELDVRPLNRVQDGSNKASNVSFGSSLSQYQLSADVAKPRAETSDSAHITLETNSSIATPSSNASSSGAPSNASTFVPSPSSNSSMHSTNYLNFVKYRDALDLHQPIYSDISTPDSWPFARAHRQIHRRVSGAMERALREKPGSYPLPSPLLTFANAHGIRLSDLAPDSLFSSYNESSQRSIDDDHARARAVAFRPSSRTDAEAEEEDLTEVDHDVAARQRRLEQAAKQAQALREASAAKLQEQRQWSLQFWPDERNRARSVSDYAQQLRAQRRIVERFTERELLKDNALQGNGDHDERARRLHQRVRYPPRVRISE